MGFCKPVISLHGYFILDGLMLIVDVKTDHKFAHDGSSCFLYNGIVVN